MELISCQIENFGHLANIRVDFVDGVNVFYKENGWGKSTLAAFLKAMFFGFDGKKEKDAIDKERKLYEPWQGGAYGGQVDFEISGKRYRVIRVFGKTEKSDVFQLYDLDTLTESKDFSSRLGEELFDLDGASFKRSCFIAQNEVLVDSSDQIHAKLGNLAENTNDMNNYEAAMAGLKAAMNRLTPDRATGSLKKSKARIAELTEELKSYQAAEEGFEKASLLLEGKLADKALLEKERGALAQELRKASEVSKHRVEVETLKTYMASWEEKLAVFDEKRAVFPGEEIPEKELVDALLIEYRELEQLQATIKGARLTEEDLLTLEDKKKFSEANAKDIVEMLGIASDLQNMNIDLAEKRQIYQTKREMLKNENLGELFPELEKKSSQLCLGCGVVLALIVEVIHYFLYGFNWMELHYLAGGVLGFGIIVFAISRFVEVRKFKKKLAKADEKQKLFFEPLEELKEQINSAELRMSEKEREIEKYLSFFGIEAENKEYLASLYRLDHERAEMQALADRKKAFSEDEKEYQNKVRTFKEKVAALHVPKGNRIFETLMQMKEQIQEYEMASLAVVDAMKLVEQYRADKPQVETYTDIYHEFPYSIEEYNEKIEAIDLRLAQLGEELQSYRHNLEYLEEQMDLRDEKEQELEELKVLQAKEELEYRVLQASSHFLEEAHKAFNAKYMEPVSQGFERYFNGLVGKDAKEWLVDAHMEWKYKEFGEYRDAKWLSEGWKDVIGICMRLALVDAMYPGEKPFLVLDDPFVNLDEDKLERAQNLLELLEKNYQVIYFTCHSSRM